MDSRRVSHPAPAGAGVQNTPQIPLFEIINRATDVIFDFTGRRLWETSTSTPDIKNQSS